MQLSQSNIYYFHFDSIYSAAAYELTILFTTFNTQLIEMDLLAQFDPDRNDLFDHHHALVRIYNCFIIILLFSISN